jgi:hypothetical protein
VNSTRFSTPQESNYYINDTNADELLGFDFVFLSLDKGSTKRSLVAKLEQSSSPFVDVGMGVEEHDGSLSGLLRITTCTPASMTTLPLESHFPTATIEMSMAATFRSPI